MHAGTPSAIMIFRNDSFSSFGKRWFVAYSKHQRKTLGLNARATAARLHNAVRHAVARLFRLGGLDYRWHTIRPRATEVNLKGNEIRSTFLDYFGDRGHRKVRSSSLVPVNDPTLLFTNAGMNQFKDVFLGLERRDFTHEPHPRRNASEPAANTMTSRMWALPISHHTFFEMLGNFSFGDYFKKDAIAYAWELITSPNCYGIPLDRLYFTVFGGAEIAPGKVLPTDEEAINLWGHRRAAWSRNSCPRPQGKLLGHGGYRSLWALQRNTLRYGPHCVGPGDTRTANSDATAAAMSKSGISSSCSLTATPRPPSRLSPSLRLILARAWNGLPPSFKEKSATSTRIYFNR